MTITTIYVGVSSNSSRKAVKFFDENNVPYTIKQYKREPISNEEINGILEDSDIGTECFFKKPFYEKNKEFILGMTLEECKTFIRKNPNALKFPIIIQGEKNWIGYNEEEYKTFFSKEARKMEREKLEKLEKLLLAI
ncbi:hypothetical protein MZM54_02830 [[Brevibacterium] frigoritolerans]|nr:hypothetical protein [Peribacillus frigoritolerans]